MLPSSPILIVEDDADSRDSLAGILGDAGYEVVTASNGREALDLLTAAGGMAPSLIVLDLEMPVMSGWEFLETIRNYLRLASIPVVVHTGTDRRRAMLAHPAPLALLPKPIEPDALLATVRELGA